MYKIFYLKNPSFKNYIFFAFYVQYFFKTIIPYYIQICIEFYAYNS